ncbi:C-terminal domain phosphatase-like 1 isoform X1 [Carex rostrata]
MFKSLVYIANSPVGEVEVYPKNTNLITPVREIRISHLTPQSERCPPLAVLHTVGSGGVCFLMECKDESAPLFSMHTACLRDNKTAVIPIGGEEIHLVAMNSRKDLNSTAKTACFWGFKVGDGLYNSCLTMLNTRCLGIVFDLDETLIVANTTRSFEDRIESLQRKIINESDTHRISGMIAEIKRYQEDRSLLKQYAEGDQVIDNGKIYKVQSEVVPRLSDVYPLMNRPIIRLPERGIVLTRINPSVRDTSVLVKLRPGWEELRSYLTARGRKRFEVYVCTMAERDYALEMWRLLDPDFNLISSSLLLDRIVCVKAGTKKSLQGVFQDGTCHPKMALVIDDRLKVWDENDQCRVHVVPAFAPYYAPQAEANSTPPVLHVARNVACSVRGSFFKEFDDSLLPQIGAVFYEDDFSGFPSAPDAGNYLISEDENVAPNGNKDPLGFDGMADAEVERRLKQEATTGVQSINSKPTTTLDPRLVLPNQYTASPHPTMGVPITVPQPLVPLTAPQVPPPPVPFPVQVTPAVIPEASPAHTSQAREEGEVPESELDPDTRRRLLILQHGQDTRDTPPPFPVASAIPAVPVPPVPVPVAPVPMQSINRGPLGPVQYPMEPDRRLPYPPFPSDRVGGQNQRFPPPQVPRGDDRVRQSNAPLNHKRSTGFDQPPSNKDTAVGALQTIAMKCGSKVEFRPIMCDTADLMFCIEVWLVGEKIGEGTGRTRKEAQHQAAEISLKNLANKYISGALSDLEKTKENGYIKGANVFGYNNIADMKAGSALPITGTSDESHYIDPRNANSKRTLTSIASLRELCTAEGYSLVFLQQPQTSDGSTVAQVEIAGQILGKGVGPSWEEAKFQAAEEALESLKPMLGQVSRKRSSPWALAAMSNKHLKSDYTQHLQRIPSSGR